MADIYTWTGLPAQYGDLDSSHFEFTQKFNGGFCFNLVTNAVAVRFKLYRNNKIMIHTIMHGYNPVGSGSNYIIKNARCCGDTLTLGIH